MNKIIKKSWLLLLLVSFGLSTSSCSDDDNDEPSAVVGKVTITNSSTYTLTDFTVNFINDSYEIITREKKGTLKPNEKVTVDIPIGATNYYMGTTSNGRYYWSPNYSTSVKSQVLTDQIIGNWTANS